MTLKGILIIFVAAIFVIFMAKLSIKKRPSAQLNVMRHDKSMHYFAWMSFLIGTLPIISFLTEPADDIWVGLLLLTPFGYWGFLYLLSAKYEYTDTYIEHTSWVTQSDVHLWRSLLCVEYDDGRGGNNKRVASYILMFPQKDILIPDGTENLTEFLLFLSQKGIDISSGD